MEETRLERLKQEYRELITQRLEGWGYSREQLEKLDYEVLEVAYQEVLRKHIDGCFDGHGKCKICGHRFQRKRTWEKVCPQCAKKRAFEALEVRAEGVIDSDETDNYEDSQDW